MLFSFPAADTWFSAGSINVRRVCPAADSAKNASNKGMLVKTGNPFLQIKHDVTEMGVFGLGKIIVQALLVGSATGAVVGLFRHLNDAITLWLVGAVGQRGLAGHLMVLAVFGVFCSCQSFRLARRP